MDRLLVMVAAGLTGLACTVTNPAPPLAEGAAEGGAVVVEAGAGEGASPGDRAGPRRDGCATKAFYKDQDGDGFGFAAGKVQACQQPLGHVANSLDCDDLDPAAHPGQSAFFTVPTKGTGRFDYDCDGVETREVVAAVSCAVAGMSCVGDGWMGPVPSCGTTGVWAKCTKQGAGRTGCGTTTFNRIQSCH